MHITEICLECGSRNVRAMNEREKSNPDYYTHVRSMEIDECNMCASVPTEDQIYDEDEDYEDED